MLGVTDQLPRRIVGTAAFDTPDRTKIGLLERLHLRIKLIEIVTSAGRVLSVVVPSRPPGRLKTGEEHAAGNNAAQRKARSSGLLICLIVAREVIKTYETRSDLLAGPVTEPRFPGIY